MTNECTGRLPAAGDPHAIQDEDMMDNACLILLDLQNDYFPAGGRFSSGRNIVIALSLAGRTDTMQSFASLQEILHSGGGQNRR
jgi:hypothetical protein